MFLGLQRKVFFEPFWDPAATAQRNHRGSAPLVPPCHVPRWCGLGKEYTNLSAYCTSQQKPSTADHIVSASQARMIQTDLQSAAKSYRVWGHTATLLSKMTCASTLGSTKQNFLQTRKVLNSWTRNIVDASGETEVAVPEIQQVTHDTCCFLMRNHLDWSEDRVPHSIYFLATICPIEMAI